MTSNVVAARQSTTAREIGARLLLGDFNGLPVIDSNAKVIGIVTAVDIFRAIRQGKNLDSVRVIDIMTRNYNDTKSGGSQARYRSKRDN
jgi:CBS domain-containing protein